MTDSDDEYLDSYVHSLLQDAIQGASKIGIFDQYGRDTVAAGATKPPAEEGRRSPFASYSPVHQTSDYCVVRRSFSSPSVPEYGRYVSNVPDMLSSCRRRYSDLDQAVEQEDQYPLHSAVEDKDLADRCSEYFRGLEISPYYQEMRGYDAGQKREQGCIANEMMREKMFQNRDESESEISDEGDWMLGEYPNDTERPLMVVHDEREDIALPKPKMYPVEAAQDLEEQFDPPITQAEQHIDFLCQRIEELAHDRDDLIDYVKLRDQEWMEMSERLHAEVLDLRQQNTDLISDQFSKGRRVSKKMADALLRAQLESDQALTTTIERQHKINELRLLVTMQQRYILALEESVQELQTAIKQLLAENPKRDDQGEGLIVDPCYLSSLPQRHPAEGHRYSSYNDVINCDRSWYTPGKTTNPELATAEVFNFGGDVPRESTRDLGGHERVFQPLDIPYVKGCLLEA